ncbi:amino acid--[acyl-carrier-protein] ligase [Curtobacterium sp. MCBD17_013]|uniref:amino acid--[acyl-carrier-protein] ligase n=1 Tax=Curtobacterium sp. MCBD17_013 TaxID=2175668 RepID=UPI000DA9C20C|nr:amino acid--[acyl-carrier-protein] ligase [Curtobacterium sp. MCBD17_013]PZF66300.1 amino acid--[acyl-carrier-protein] ligase [Curtobacterium sp. MCBD17_013]
MTDTTTAPQTTDLDAARLAFRDELVDAGLLVPAGEPGLFGRNGTFDDVVDAVDRYITLGFAELAPERIRFAPVIARSAFERTDYVASFPQLTGAIHTFTGSDRDHAALLAARAAGEDWDRFLHPGETMLVSAVCHPLYDHLAGQQVDGRVFDVVGYTFRHEPSDDPMRLQSFRMHEFVYVGGEDDARTFRNTWSERQAAMLAALGLDVTRVPANDPFFGRAGKFLAANQLTDELKIEVTVPIYPGLSDGTAIASANSAGDHFGAPFGITTADGSVAHTSCIAFGMERITLALFRTFGTSLADWPVSTLDQLSLR